VFGYTMYPAS